MNNYFIPFAVLLILFVISVIIVPVSIVIHTKVKKLKIAFLPKEKKAYKLLIIENKELKEVEEKQQQTILELQSQLERKDHEIKSLLNVNEEFLLRVNNLSAADAKNELFEFLTQKYRKELAINFVKLKKEFSDGLEIYSQNLLIEAMERSAEPLVINRSLFTINFGDENLKGKIIGRDGRNKALFEKAGGVDLIVERNDTILSISSPNPMRREIARRVMQKLIDSRNIDMNRIELLFREEKEKFDQEAFEVGREVIEDQLNFFDIPKELYPYVGKMRFRTSYGQNILTHSLEVAHLAENLAYLIGIDPIKAKKCAFFHDIGKVIDFESNMDHVEAGVMLAKQYKLSDYIINGIESHHSKVIATSIYAALIKVVDTISAARPGARIANYDEYFGRVSELEKICMQFYGIESAFVIRSGRQLRVIANAELVNDSELELLAHKIQRAIETSENLSNYKISIIMTREKRISIETNTIS